MHFIITEILLLALHPDLDMTLELAKRQLLYNVKGPNQPPQWEENVSFTG